MNFDSTVVYFDQNDCVPLTAKEVLKMVEITNEGGSDLAVEGGPIDVDEVEVITHNARTVITISPPDGLSFSAGNHVAKVNYYAKYSDANFIRLSREITEYLGLIESQQAFNIIVPETACTRGEEGYFELIKSYECIKLPEISWTYTPYGGDETVEHTGDRTTAMKIKFDSEIVYLDKNGRSLLTKEKVLDMIDIIPSGGSDLAVEGGPIGEDEVSLTTSDDRTVITILPPNDLTYEAGNYAVKIKNYSSTNYVQEILDSLNLQDYLAAVEHEQDFTIIIPETACTRGEEGYFELIKPYECIKLPEVSWAYTPKDGDERVEHNGDRTTAIKIKFDSEIVYLDENGQSSLTEQKVLDMIDIIPSGGGDLAVEGGPIGRDKITISVPNNKTIINIEPPNNGMYSTAGDYLIRIKNYSSVVNAGLILNSSNSRDYLNLVSSKRSFNISLPVRCDRNLEGHFELDYGSGNYECNKTSSS